jgi:hypothetical protein
MVSQAVPEAMQPDYSICIPSNRPLDEARASLMSAITATACGNGEVIVSDNSGDPAKAAWLREAAAQLPGRCLVVDSPGASAEANWSACIDRARGRFIGILSDDDVLQFMGPPCFDHPPDVAAVKPHIAVWEPTKGITRVNAFPLDGATAQERVQAYAQQAAGSNTTFYSFIRADVFRSVWELCVRAHPTQGSYIDWAQVFGWVSSGRYVVDPGIVLVYCNRNWSGEVDALRKRIIRQYTSVGLPERIVPFASALQALDVFILVARRDSPVGGQERLDAAVWALAALSQPLTALATQHPGALSPEERRILQRLAIAADPEALLGGLLRLLDHFDPTLAQRYVAFYEAAIGAPWGEFPEAA